MKSKGISIIIPVWNEEENITSLVKNLDLAFCPKAIPYELIFVDDHSTDRTRQKLISLSNKYPLSVYLKNGQKGKAYSLMEGFPHARYGTVGIIDGDLQYPPAAIPEMIEKINKGADIVVANRGCYEDSKIRKILSSGFRIGFGKIIFGLNHDVQSGLKVFRKEVIETINFRPASGWTFDLEFLHRSREAGFKIENHDIVFQRRQRGNSKIGRIKTTWEIGTQALRLKFKQIAPHHVFPSEKNTMLGAGVRYKKQKYITHTTLSHHKSAIQTLTLEQKILLISIVLLFIGGLVLNPLVTASALVAILSLIYFIDVLFNLYLVLKSLHFPPEISVTVEEINELEEESLPTYSILCPLYKEGRVLPQFLSSIEKIDWPKNKLEVLLLLEKDDEETLEAIENINLPSYVRLVTVPHSQPKTKPKACNYGLLRATGEYLVVYDAEDMPDPQQLKKTYLGFKKVPDDVICLQAKLNYYNPHQNILTRLFAAEYALWFDLTLTGLQSINTSIPLGGTSNHFKTKDLLKLEGWDPFNVTEDADLGVRLFKEGYKTAIIDSTTLEEANSKLKNWLRQRSRWIKGYMQTYLVHTRRTLPFIKNKGLHSLIFQLVVGGKIAFILINPFLWVATIAYFLFYAWVGPTIESLYLAPVFYMAVLSLIFGNFMFVYYYMIGAIKRREWSLVKYVYLVPIYWAMISTAGFVALYQLLFKPHYWEKTVHGFHLKTSVKKIIPELIIGTESNQAGIWSPLPLGRKLVELINSNKKIYASGVSLIGAAIIANFLNFLFNAYLGRKVSLDNFALINLTGGFFALTTIISGAFGLTVNYRSGFLIGRFGDDRYAYKFWRYIRRKSLHLALAMTIIWFALSPILSSYFKTGEVFLFVLFGSMLLIRLAAASDQGFLAADFMFIFLAIVNLTEPLLKLAIAFFLVQLDLSHLAYSAIPLSVIGSFVLGWILIVRNRKPAPEPTAHHGEIEYFPKKFFLVSLLTGLSTVMFLTLDILLAKHFLTATEAGQYALLSLAGKMVYFLGNLSAPFMMPLISRREGASKNSQKTFSLILLSTTVLATLGFVVFGLLGKYTVPVLWGPKALSITQYLTIFSFSMACFVIAKVFTTYYIAKKVYTFSFAALFSAIIQIVLISIYHSSIGSIVLAMAVTGTLNLILMVLLHLNLGWVKIFERNLTDFLGLFAKEAEVRQSKEKQFKILIFNWRDIKHKFAGGAEVYIHEFAKRWVKEGHRVTLFCGNDGNHMRQESIDNVEIIRRGGFYFVYVWAFLYYIFRFKGKYDVIIDCENGVPFFTPLYAKNERKFLLIHHVHQEVFRKSLKKPLAWFASFLELKLMPIVYWQTPVITVSDSSKQEILRHKLTSTEPIIIHNGVDLIKYTPAQKSETPLVLYLGRLQQYKSLDIFIKAAKRVLEILPEVNFIIAGDGEKKKELTELTRKLNLEDKITFLGKVSEEEKVRLYQKAWVFVNPSFIEGWGITTIEANACGTPVVASDVPGLCDSVKNPHSGILVPWGNVDQFAYSIEQILFDKELRSDLEKRTRAWAKNFSWEKSAQKFLNTITDSLDTNREKQPVEEVVFETIK